MKVKIVCSLCEHPFVFATRSFVSRFHNQRLERHTKMSWVYEFCQGVIKKKKGVAEEREERAVFTSARPANCWIFVLRQLSVYVPRIYFVQIKKKGPVRTRVADCGKCKDENWGLDGDGTQREGRKLLHAYMTDSRTYVCHFRYTQ